MKMFSILRRGNTDGFSLFPTPLTIGLLSFVFLLLMAQSAVGQTDPSSTASEIEYEIVFPVASSVDLSSPPSFVAAASPQLAALNWQGEWMRRFSPRVVAVQNGWKYRTLPRSDDISDTQQRIVLHKKWSALEPSIRFL